MLSIFRGTRAFSTTSRACAGKPMSKEAQAFLASISTKALTLPPTPSKKPFKGGSRPSQPLVAPSDMPREKWKSQRNNQAQFKHSPMDVRYVPPGRAARQPEKRLDLRRYPFTSGTDTAQKAVQAVVNDILALSLSGAVSFVNPKGRLEESTVGDILKSLDLGQFGLSMVLSDQVEVPLVKQVPILQSIKAFSNKMAEQRAEDMKDNSTYKRSLRMALRKKQKGDIKQVRIGWNISLTDLSTKKHRDIVAQLRKGSKVHIYIANKWQLRKLAQASRKQGTESEAVADAEEEEPMEELEEEEVVEGKALDEMQEFKRTQVLDTLLALVLPYCKPIVEGGILDQVVIRLEDAKFEESSAPEGAAEPVSDRKELARLKKQERQDKAKRIAEEKRAAKGGA